METRLGKPIPAGETIGESWEISAHALHVSRVAEGPLAGMPLTDLWARHRQDLAGPAAAAADPFPLLIKYLDCQQLLSIQVHPNDEIAGQIQPGSLGKDRGLGGDRCRARRAGLRRFPAGHATGRRPTRP